MSQKPRRGQSNRRSKRGSFSYGRGGSRSGDIGAWRPSRPAREFERATEVRTAPVPTAYSLTNDKIDLLVRSEKSSAAMDELMSRLLTGRVKYTELSPPERSMALDDFDAQVVFLLLNAARSFRTWRKQTVARREKLETSEMTNEASRTHSGRTQSFVFPDDHLQGFVPDCEYKPRPADLE
ncbi:MAG: uncharacterized protein KVP18_002193 [Porospora cf. gigantea A]|uniref:uncharacterized protein n=1 Tax=Porospora cf. gigantea A TaxID=2853593 RepID=UPI00355AA0AD|nr:MAG: hypothetical protein KVP18_002193 [Porospora cf. gigantea A]